MIFNLEKQAQARKELSEEILKWSGGKKYLFLEMATSTGKSFNTFNIISSSYKGGKILALFPEITLIDSFRLDCIKLGFQSLLEEMTLACYASLHKYVDEDWSWVIMDEGHHVISDIRIDLVGKLKFQRVIGLSATLSEDTEDILFGALPFDKFVLTASEAIERSILPEPEIRVQYVELDDSLPKNTFKYGKKEVLLTDKEYYKKLSESITYWRELYQDKGENYQKLKMLSQGSARQRFLAKCKTEAAKELILHLNKRHIVFCGSLDQAKELNGKQLVSSERSKKTNLKMIEDFNEGKTNCLFAKSMLKEGINLKDCPIGIIIQMNNQEKDFCQMLGRCLRDSSPIMYVLLVKGTVDERFFDNSTKSLNKDYLTF